jgi:CopG family nickel-responsive transcriptional regulator
VVVIKGPAGEIRRLADELIGTKGVKHGRLMTTTTGRDIV